MDFNYLGSYLSDEAYKIIKNDAPEPWGLFFQDSASPQMEGLEELHNNIMYYLAIILFAVSWVMISIVINFNRKKISNKRLTT